MKFAYYALLGLSLGLITPSVLGMSASEKSNLKKEIETGLSTFATLDQAGRDALLGKITSTEVATAFSTTDINDWKTAYETKVFDEKKKALKADINSRLTAFATDDQGALWEKITSPDTATYFPAPAADISGWETSFNSKLVTEIKALLASFLPNADLVQKNLLKSKLDNPLLATSATAIGESNQVAELRQSCLKKSIERRLRWCEGGGRPKKIKNADAKNALRDDINKLPDGDDKTSYKNRLAQITVDSGKLAFTDAVKWNNCGL